MPLARAIVFSRDRALQLTGLLDSLFLSVVDPAVLQVTVLYRTTSDRAREHYDQIRQEWVVRGVNMVDEDLFGFEASLRKLVFDPHAPPAILFLVDDVLFVHGFSVREAVETLQSRTSAIGFSLRNGINTDRSRGFEGMTSWRLGAPVERLSDKLEQVTPNVMAYYWTESIGNFGYPLEVSSSIYRTDDVREWLDRLIGQVVAPNPLESGLAGLYDRKSRPELLMFVLGCAFTMPLNRVQSLVPNLRSTLDADLLDRLFASGYRIDVASYRGYLYETCHEVLMLNTINFATGSRLLLMPGPIN